MIEFKADCGHIIQASDRDAGTIVKCAYCGREVEAPSRKDPDTDLLLREVDLSELARGEGAAGGRSLTIHGQQKRAKSAPTPEDIAEVGSRAMRVLAILAFVTICLVLAVIILRSVRDLAEHSGRPVVVSQDNQAESAIGSLPDVAERARQAHAAESGSPEPPASQPSDPQPVPVVGHTHGGRLEYEFNPDSQGIFVETFGSGPEVFLWACAAHEPPPLELDPNAWYGRGSRVIVLPPGQYRLATVVSLPDLYDGGLPGIRELQARLDLEDDARAAEEYFVRDLSWAIAYQHPAGSRPRIVRYYDVEVRAHAWTLVTSLFVPDRSLAERLPYFPDVQRYDFSDQDARALLASYNVPHELSGIIVELLTRSGQVVYPLGEGLFRVFEIDVLDGSVRSREFEFDAESAALQTTHREFVAHSSETPAAEVTTRPPPASQPPRSVNPFDRGRRGSSVPTVPSARPAPDLQDIVADLEARSAAGATAAADEFVPYLSGGQQHERWIASDVEHRVALVELIDQQAARELVSEVGRTMNEDPDLEVRLALLDILVLSDSKRAVSFIDERLETLGREPQPDEVKDRERKALERAREKLLADTGRRRNPWNR